MSSSSSSSSSSPQTVYRMSSPPSSMRNPRPASSSSSSRQSDTFKPKLPLDPFSGMDDFPQPWPIDNSQLTTAITQKSKQVILLLGSPSVQTLEPLITAKSLSSSLLIIATHIPPILPQSTTNHHGPAIRVLVLSEPIFAPTAGALRLVNLLQRAERVARLWRGSSVSSQNKKKKKKLKYFDDQPRVLYLSEAETTREFTQVFTPPLPPASANPSLSTPPPSRPASTVSSGASSSFSKSASKRMSRINTTLPPTDPAQRPFDAILDFLQAEQEKNLLKQAILVTTLSQPFLSAIPSIPGLRHTGTGARSRRNSVVSPRPPSSVVDDDDASIHSAASSSAGSSKSSTTRARWSAIFIGGKSGLSSTATSDGTPDDNDSIRAGITPVATTTPGGADVVVDPTLGTPVERSHIIHVLPPMMLDGLEKRYPKSKLTQSIEQFLVNFSYPETTLTTTSSSSSKRYSSASMMPPAMAMEVSENQAEKAVPFLLPTHALCGVPILGGDTIASEMTIAELILNGLLDPKTPSASLLNNTKGKRASSTMFLNALQNPPRAWVGGAPDVKLASDIVIPFGGSVHATPAAPPTRHSSTWAGATGSPSSKRASFLAGPERYLSPDTAVTGGRPSSSVVRKRQSASALVHTTNNNNTGGGGEPYGRSSRSDVTHTRSSTSTRESSAGSRLFEYHNNTTPTTTTSTHTDTNLPNTHPLGLPTPPDSSSSSEEGGADGPSAPSTSTSPIRGAASRSEVDLDETADEAIAIAIDPSARWSRSESALTPPPRTPPARTFTDSNVVDVDMTPRPAMAAAAVQEVNPVRTRPRASSFKMLFGARRVARASGSEPGHGVQMNGAAEENPVTTTKTRWKFWKSTSSSSGRI